MIKDDAVLGLAIPSQIENIIHTTLYIHTDIIHTNEPSTRESPIEKLREY